MACPMKTYSGSHTGGDQYVIHDFFDPSTSAWQYVIVDPVTRSCVVIDPVLDHTKDRIAISTMAADRLLSFVRNNNYTVDIMLETLSSSRNNRSGAWYLRSQLLRIQGHAPRVCGTQAAQPFGNLFARKWGYAPSTHSDEEFVDGDSIHVGHMKITMLQLPGLKTPDGRAYQIGENVFGAHTVASLKTKMQQDSASVRTAGADGIHRAWTSFQKVLGMPAHYRLHFDQESGSSLATPKTKVKFGGADEQAVEARPYATVAECRPTGDEVRVMAEETEVLLDADSTGPPPPIQAPKPKQTQKLQRLKSRRSGFFSPEAVSDADTRGMVTPTQAPPIQAPKQKLKPRRSGLFFSAEVVPEADNSGLAPPTQLPTQKLKPRRSGLFFSTEVHPETNNNNNGLAPPTQVPKQKLKSRRSGLFLSAEVVPEVDNNGLAPPTHSPPHKLKPRRSGLFFTTEVVPEEDNSGLAPPPQKLKSRRSGFFFKNKN